MYRCGDHTDRARTHRPTRATRSSGTVWVVRTTRPRCFERERFGPNAAASAPSGIGDPSDVTRRGAWSGHICPSSQVGPLFDQHTRPPHRQRLEPGVVEVQGFSVAPQNRSPLPDRPVPPPPPTARGSGVSRLSVSCLRTRGMGSWGSRFHGPPGFLTWNASR